MNLKSHPTFTKILLRFLGFSPIESDPVILRYPENVIRQQKLEDENMIMRILINEKVKPALKKVSNDSSSLIKVTAETLMQENKNAL